ncbi:hypothetical protein OESDEN_20516 [Oesophagostomum dentatum]|uniref:ET module n=1 Tax=Oesophagostomum dentatum TaxID=61180 RepID=A0A0B1S4F8_OESDE|nr:hypothetical protein OESDEN_20516 [Oesophagostomum dentatum]
MSRYCMKKAVKADKDTLNYYDCATSECTKNDCTTNANKVTTCCCNKDLCNASPLLSSLFVIVPIAVARLII